MFSFILPSLVRRADELLDPLFLYIVILLEVAVVHVAQAQILAFFGTSLRIEGEADHSEVVSMNSVVQLSCLAEAGRILPLRVYGSSALQEEFSCEILLQRAQVKLLVLLKVLDLHEFSRIFAPLDVLQLILLRQFQLHCSTLSLSPVKTTPRVSQCSSVRTTSLDSQCWIGTMMSFVQNFPF